MTDYSNAKIYKLTNDVDDEIYIGSTTQTLTRRFSEHKCYARRSKSRLYNHMNKLGYENFKIELLEEYPCNNKYELEGRESELIREFGTLNIRIEDRKKNEYDKLYRERNKYEINENKKKYYEKNKELINKKAKEKITCSCGMETRKDNFKRHQRTQKHKEAIKTMQLEIN